MAASNNRAVAGQHLARRRPPRPPKEAPTRPGSNFGPISFAAGAVQWWKCTSSLTDKLGQNHSAAWRGTHGVLENHLGYGMLQKCSLINNMIVL